MSAAKETARSRGWPLAIALIATLGSVVTALIIVRPPYFGDPGPGFVIPEPSLVQYVLAAACVIIPVAATVRLLLRPSHPWRTIAFMLATVFGLVDLLMGIALVIFAVLAIQAVLRGTWPSFF